MESTSTSEQLNFPQDISFVDAKTLTLNHEQSFAVFDRWGDIFNFGQRLQGVFHRGTRYISKLELKISGRRPLLLSSTVRLDNDVLSVDLVNPPIVDGEWQLPASTVHFRRTKLLNQNILFERIVVQSFYEKPVQFEISLGVEGDFKDIFELRGVERKVELGDIQRNVREDCLELIYHSLDGVRRCAQVSVEGGACKIHEGGLVFYVELQPGEKKEVEYNVALLIEGDTANHLKYRQGLEDLESEIHQIKSRIGQARSSNEQFNYWFNRSRLDLVTLLTRHDDIFYPNAGVPWYNTVFGRDGLITAIQTLNFAPSIAQGVLRYLAKYQSDSDNPKQDAEPGKILHEIRQGELANLGELPFKKYFGSADATPLFVWLTGLYFKRTGDIQLVKSIWPQVKQALEWIERYGDKDRDGFVEYERRSADGLLNQGWKDSHDSMSHRDGSLLEGGIALCEVQAYVYQALRQGAYLAEVIGEDDLQKKLTHDAENLKTRFKSRFWDESWGYVAMALDGKKNPSRVLSSNPGHCLACEILESSEAQAVADKLFSPALFSGWGIRTLGKDEVRYNPMSYHNGSVWPHDNSLIAYGLAKYKQKGKLLTLVSALFDASLFVELQRIPELYCGFERRRGEGPTLYPVACSPQAWAVGTVFMILTSLLGLEIDAQKKHIYFRYPVLPPWLNEVRLNEIPLSSCSNLDIRCIRYGNDVGFDVVSLPDDWEITIKK